MASRRRSSKAAGSKADLWWDGDDVLAKARATAGDVKADAGEEAKNTNARETRTTDVGESESESGPNNHQTSQSSENSKPESSLDRQSSEGASTEYSTASSGTESEVPEFITMDARLALVPDGTPCTVRSVSSPILVDHPPRLAAVRLAAAGRSWPQLAAAGHSWQQLPAVAG
jgi:hypothetical protein